MKAISPAELAAVAAFRARGFEKHTFSPEFRMACVEAAEAYLKAKLNLLPTDTLEQLASTLSEAQK